jgi:hypothetical protein
MRQRGEMSVFAVFAEKTRLKRVQKASRSFNSSYFLVNTAQLRYSKIQPRCTAKNASSRTHIHALMLAHIHFLYRCFLPLQN